MDRVIKFFKRPFYLLDKHKVFVNNFLPFFFLTYFVLVFLPYVVADFSLLNDFFMGSVTKLIFRGMTTIYLCIYGLILGYVNKQGFKWPFIICGLVLLICYAISIILAPKMYTYSLIDLTHRVELYTLHLGTYSYFTYGFSFLADIVSFVIFISYIPSALKNVDQLYLTLYFLVAFMFIACIYSLIKERSQIMQIIRGGSEYSITVRSFFHSKNAFGLYLFIGAISSAFLLVTMRSKWRWLFVIPQIAFSIMSLLAMCKSALLCCLVLDILIIWHFAFFAKGTTFYISLTLMIISILSLIGLILIVTIPFFKEGTFAPIHSLLDKLFKGIFTRTDRWIMVKYVVDGPFILIGLNETNSIFYLEILSNILQNQDIVDFHSAYVTWYAQHGIIGCIVYLGLLGYIVYNIVCIFKHNKFYGFLLTIIFISCLVFMIPESYVLFISISSYTFIINMILICPMRFLNNKKDNCKEVIQNE